MSKNLHFLAVIGLCVLASACNKMTPEQMAAKASDIVIVCNPEVLTLVNGKIDVSLTCTYPAKYFCPEARMTVTPVLVYGDKEVKGDSFFYQGDKIKDNFKTISSDGGTVKEKCSFDFADGMQVSHLELRGTVLYGGSEYALPTRKVADGVNTTALLADLTGRCSYKADDYQFILHRTAEGQVLYTVNSSKVRSSQLNSQSIEDYHDQLDRIKQNDRYTIKGTQIVSYASPEGGKKFNDKLSDKRSDSAQKAWEIVGRGMEADGVDIISIGQDWEGFRKAVEQSKIKDKDLILRVLSMYSDPAVRESEIRNLSEIYTELKTVIFPELRRSRFVTNLDYRNYSEEDLDILAQQKIYMLDEEGLLRLASITDSPARREFLYNFAFEKFASKRAGYNLAAQAWKEGRAGAIGLHLDRLNDENDPEVANLRGLMAMKDLEWEKAEDFFEKSGTAESRSNLGILYMLQGNWTKASAVMDDDDSNKAVACLMAGAEEQAESIIKGDDALSEYLRAIVCARKGDKTAAAGHLAAAVEKDPSLAAREATDIEFAKFHE